MSFIIEFFQAFVLYINELWFSVALGFLLSGLFNEFIPTHFVDRHLGDKGFKAILIASCIGIVLPVCCFGSLPIAVTLRRKGAKLGPVLAFLVATPATSISALLVCWKLLGLNFTMYIFAAVLFMGIIMGIVGNRLKIQPLPSDHVGDNCCDHSENSEHDQSSLMYRERIKNVLRYAFITLPGEIGLELLLGIGVASFIVIFTPIQEFFRTYLAGAFGYAFILAFGLATYVCSTASVPMADALMQSGLTGGHAMMYLLVGPITSYGMIFVLKKEFGLKILLVYLTLISSLSFLIGIMFNYLLGN